MRILKKLLGTLVAGALVLVAVALLLPGRVHVDRSAAIEAPSDRVFALINDPRAFNRWSPWARMDPQTHYTFAGPESGVGARMTWARDNPNVGSGSLEIVASEVGRRVVMKLDFGPHGTATASYDLQTLGGGTRVTWAFDTEFGDDLAARFLGLVLPRWIGEDYEKGLANLKALAEGKSGVPLPRPAGDLRMARRATPAGTGGPRGGA